MSLAQQNASLLLTPLLAALFLFFCTANIARAEDIFSELDLYDDIEYVVRLTNGDIISGYPVEFISDKELGEGIKLKTALGDASIYADQVLEILPRHAYYRHGHRMFVMPSALPIRGNHFVGAAELVALYAGIGIGDIVSLTALRTAIPTLPAADQASALNLKATVYSTEADFVPGSISFAAGGNLAFLNDNNRFVHLYFAATLSQRRTRVTANLFYKLGSEDFYIVRAGERFDPFSVNYANGGFGVGLGLDTKFTHRHDLHFLAELWNSDVTSPTNTGVFLGLRLANSAISLDFGVAVFTQPAFAPITTFAWTPF